MRPDFVAEMVSLMEEEATLDPAARARLAKKIRLRFGGQRVFIRSSEPVQARVSIEQVEAKLRARKKVESIAGDFGIARSTMYRLLRKSQKRP